MKSVFTIIPILLSTVSALPSSYHVRRANSSAKVPMGKGKSAPVGSAYFITNEPSGNFVVAADLASDGTMALRQAVATGGSGSHGLDGGANGPDPLFTQGAVKASKSGQVLVTVNSGSNTISAFNINPSNPSDISPLGFPVGSGGEFPVSVALNEAGNRVCALNGGAVNGVNCFQIDKSSGLTPIANSNRSLSLNQTTPATGPAGSVSHIVFTEDNKQLVVSVKGVPPTPGFLAVWDIADDGSLSENFQSISPAQGGLLPFSMTIIPQKNAILATDAGIGFDIFSFDGVSGAGGNSSDSQSANNFNRSSSVVKIDGQMATCWSSFSPKTGNFYLTDVGTSIVTEVNVDDNLKGSIVKQYSQGQGSATIDNDIASIQKNDFMYVLRPNATAVNVVSLIAPGQTKIIQQLDIAKPAQAAGLTVSASHLQGMTTFIS